MPIDLKSSLDATPFTVHVVGDVSQTPFDGAFKCRVKLSYRDQLRMDQVRREILGPDGPNASPRAQNTAELLSQLAIHLCDSPNWWKDSNGGLDLMDDNVLAAVWEQVRSIKQAATDAAKAAAEAVKAELKQ